MYRDKTIIKLRKESKGHLWEGYWSITRGTKKWHMKIGISRLFRLIATLIQDKGKVYSIDIIIKRKR
jgi:hypothetical protein